MDRITIGGLSDGLVQRLQRRATAKGLSVEEAALEILNGALPGSADAVADYPGSASEAYERIRARYEAVGWRDDAELPSRCRCQCHK